MSVQASNRMESSRSRVHLGVTALQVAATGGYLALWTSDAPAPFSFGDWTFMVAPPLVFLSVLALGAVLRVERHSHGTVALTWLGATVAVIGLVASCLALPLGLLGSWMDAGIG